MAAESERRQATGLRSALAACLAIAGPPVGSPAAAQSVDTNAIAQGHKTVA